MKKFRFPLRSVATLRRMRETERREIFAGAVRSYVGAEEALAAVNSRIAELEEIIVRERTGCFRPADQIAFMQSLVTERTRRTEAAARVTAMKTAMENERQAWLAARRDVRLVEVLESKSRSVHRLACDREEQALLDDRTNALFARAS
jgi:flagellar export protein FliJ